MSTDVDIVMQRDVSSIWGHLTPPKMWGNLLHSDWLKFEMERSDWSCAYCHQGAPREIPYYRSNVGHFLIGREQFHHQGAPRG